MIASEALRTTLYDTMPMVGWAFVLVLYFAQYKKYTVSYCAQSLQNRTSDKKVHTIIKITEMCLVFLFLPLSTLIFNNWFGEVVKTGANYYGFLFFCPIVLAVFCCAVWVNPIKCFDFLTILMPFEFIFIRLGCFFFGCCGGFEWEYGLYNYKNERFEIPMQLIESFIALGLFVFLLFRRKKAKPGTMFPTYLTLYSLLRFFNEFLSGSPRTILIFFNKYQVLCFIGVVLGLIEYMLMLKYGERISKYFDENPYGLIKALIAKTRKPKNQKVKTK